MFVGSKKKEEKILFHFLCDVYSLLLLLLMKITLFLILKMLIHFILLERRGEGGRGWFDDYDNGDFLSTQTNFLKCALPMKGDFS